MQCTIVGFNIGRLYEAHQSGRTSRCSVSRRFVFGAGCATVEGVGEDIEDLGDEIQDEANDARR